MAKYQRNNVGSLVLDRHSNGGNHHRIWSAFSGVAFRRKLLDTMRCGVSRYRYEADSDVESLEALKEEKRTQKQEEVIQVTVRKSNVGSETLSEILNSSEPKESVEEEIQETEDEVIRRIKVFEELQGVVKKLQFEVGSKEQVEAALDVRRLAKDDSEARKTLAMLGAIPPLVVMIDSSDPDVQIASLYALLNLGIGNDLNKSAIVKAGAVHKMLNLVESPSNTMVSEAVVANFLGLSALDSNKPVIGSSGAIPFLVKTIQNVEVKCSAQAKHDSLRAIFNLSISASNISHILETNVVSFLLNTLEDIEFSERILSILSNIVSTPEGRKAISSTSDAFPILIDVLSWTDSPGCQEKVSYILMVMAHKAYGDRQAMIEAGMVSALLELTLLGSTLAQKRASRILECLRVDKRKQVSSDGYNSGVGAVSAPICGGSSSFSAGGPNLDPKQVLEELEEEEDMMSAENKAVKQLVQQSLQNNMRRIVKRANLPQDFVPSDHFKSLTTTSTSKSVPF